MSKAIQSLEDLRIFAEEFIVKHSESTAVGLSGELGAGKTTFVRFCIEKLAEEAKVPYPRVTSPTFVLHQKYPNLARPVEHFDLYRLDNINENSLTDLGYYDALDFIREKKGLLFIEWPEKCAEISILQLDFQMTFSLEGEGRKITGKM